jgi:hypothetical protein
MRDKMNHKSCLDIDRIAFFGRTYDEYLKMFDLVLSGHFLFLYGDRLDINFHISCLRELLRVSSGEVRIFPLTGLDAEPYPRLYEILCRFRPEGINATVVKVPFEFQRGANAMMKLRKENNPMGPRS